MHLHSHDLANLSRQEMNASVQHEPPQASCFLAGYWDPWAAHLDEHVHAELARRLDQVRQVLVGQHRGDEEHRVRAGRARLEQLIRLDDELRGADMIVITMRTARNTLARAVVCS